MRDFVGNRPKVLLLARMGEGRLAVDERSRSPLDDGQWRTQIVRHGAEERAALLEELRARPSTLLLVKSDRLKGLLPPDIELVGRGRHGAVTVGWARLVPTPD